MGSKMAGVALAAAMACGWAGGARADTIYLDGLSDPASFGYKNGDTPYLSYDFNYLANGEIDGFVSLGSYKEKVDGFFQYYLDKYQIFNSDHSNYQEYAFDELHYFLKTSSGDSLNFSTYNLFIAADPFSGEQIDFSFPGNFDLCRNNSSCNTASTSFYVSDRLSGLPSPVPLPASAPLFAVAVLTIAGITWKQKIFSRSDLTAAAARQQPTLS